MWVVWTFAVLLVVLIGFLVASDLRNRARRRRLAEADPATEKAMRSGRGATGALYRSQGAAGGRPESAIGLPSSPHDISNQGY